MWQNLGTKDTMGACCGPCEPQKDSKEKPKTIIRYPSFYLDLAEALPVEADSVIECKVKLRVRGFRKSDYNQERPFNVDFDVMAIDLGDAGPDVEQPDDDSQESLENSLEQSLKNVERKKQKS